MPRRAKICQSYFRSWPILSTLGSSSSGCSASSAAFSGIWSGRELRLRREQIAAALRAAVAVAERHVAGLVVGDGEREAAQLRRHRIEAGGLGVDRDDADVLGAQHPGVQPVERAHGLVFAAVESCRPCAAARWAAASAAGERSRRSPRLCCAAAAAARTDRRSCRRGPAPRRAGGRCRRGRAPAPDVSLRVRLDLVRLDAGFLRDAPRQRAELHRLEEGDQLLVVRLVHGEVLDRHFERDVLVERDQPLGDARDSRRCRSASGAACPA